MPITYTRAEAPDDIIAMLEDARDRWHPVLRDCDVTIDVLMADDCDEEGVSHRCLKLHGYGCAAIIKITPLKARALGQADALLTVDTLAWSELGHDARMALLDHELEHLEVLADIGGIMSDGDKPEQAKRDDLGRPKLRCKLHDWNLQGFRSIALRHRGAALEVQAIRACLDERTGQYAWEWPANAEEVMRDVRGEGPDRVTISSPGHQSVTFDRAAGARLRADPA